MDNREQMMEKIAQAVAEMKTAGPLHRRDLRKHVKRMQTQLKQYDRYQAMAKEGAA